MAGEVVAPASDPRADADVDERVRQYNRVVRIAKLSSILLEKIDFRILPEIYAVDSSKLQRDLNVATEIIGYDPKGGECVASITWTVSVKSKRKSVVKCVANYVVIYNQLQECQEEMVKMFIDHVGKTATYAYFRALYAHLDWSANLKSAPLPVVQFQPPVQKELAAAVAAKAARA